MAVQYWTLENSPGGPLIVLKQKGMSVRRWRAGHGEWVNCPVQLPVILGFERHGTLVKVSEDEMAELATEDAFDVPDHTWNHLLSQGAPSIYDIDWHYEVVRGHSEGRE